MKTKRKEKNIFHPRMVDNITLQIFYSLFVSIYVCVGTSFHLRFGTSLLIFFKKNKKKFNFSLFLLNFSFFSFPLHYHILDFNKNTHTHTHFTYLMSCVVFNFICKQRTKKIIYSKDNLFLNMNLIQLFQIQKNDTVPLYHINDDQKILIF